MASAPKIAMTTSTSRRSHRRPEASLWPLLQNNLPLTLVLLMALVVPLLPGPRPALPWDGASGAAFEVGGVLLMGITLWRADAAAGRRAFAWRGPTPWLLGLAAWGALTAALASGGTASLQGLLHLAAGLMVYAVAASRVRKDADYRLLLDVLTGLTLLLSVVGLRSFLMTGGVDAGALSHRSFGALLMLLLPLVLLAVAAPGTLRQRWAAQAAAVLGAATLLLARWHPAERAEAVALLVLGLLCWRLGVRLWPQDGTTLLARIQALRLATAARREAERRDPEYRGKRRARAKKRRIASNAALYGGTIVCALAVFLALTPGGGLAIGHARRSLSGATPAGILGDLSPARLLRAASPDRLLGRLLRASKNASSSDTPGGRQSAAALLAMVKARPIQGWGIGCYPVFQKQWTHQGNDGAFVLGHGPQPADRARSTYWQMAVELGLPGLALWVGALAAFFVGAGRALKRADKSPLRRRVLIGCVAAVAGQVVDAYSDGSWQFGSVSLFLWLALGLGAAASRLETDPRRSPIVVPPGRPAPARVAWGTHLRFVGVCVICAALLALIVRASG